MYFSFIHLVIVERRLILGYEVFSYCFNCGVFGVKVVLSYFTKSLSALLFSSTTVSVQNDLAVLFL